MNSERTGKRGRLKLDLEVWRRVPEKYISAGILALAAIFLGFDIQSRPIVLWDESRVVSNALEMSKTGFSLVTTYDFKPDMWNTKPPLVIWLVAASIRLFGASEWSVRLPTFIAAVLTAAITMKMAWWLTRKRSLSYLATALLVLSPGFFGEHAAQSADYDTILGLFVTSYLFCFFVVTHRHRGNTAWVLAFGALVVLACLTKGVAGLIPGVGIPFYLIVQKRWRRLVGVRYFATAVAVLFLIGAYYYFREQYNPGYFQAVQQTELGGRFIVGVNGHDQSPIYYVVLLIALSSMGPLLLLLPSAAFIKWPASRASAFFSFGLIVSIFDVLTLSVSRTKIFWYLVPVYPMLAITMTILLDRLWSLKKNFGAPRWFILTLASVLLLTIEVFTKFVVLPAAEYNAQGQYGVLFDKLSAKGVSKITVVDSGVRNTEHLVNYSPQLHFYSVLWADRGLSAEVLNTAPSRLPTGSVIVTCDPKFLRPVQSLGRSIASVRDCAAVVSGSGAVRGGRDLTAPRGAG